MSDIGPILERLRIQKTSHEMDEEELAGADWQDGFDYLLENVRELVDEYDRLQKRLALYDRLHTLLVHEYPEASGSYFICGATGEKDTQGLPEYLMICPAYGADARCTQMYKKIEREKARDTQE